MASRAAVCAQQSCGSSVAAASRSRIACSWAAPRVQQQRCATLPHHQRHQGAAAGVLSPVGARSIPVSGPGQTPPTTSVAPEGQISAALMTSMRDKISEALETQDVVVQDVYGDGRHVSIDVVSSVFEGKNAVQRQRLVYKAIWLELQEAVHAVDAMTTRTPQEAGK